MVLKLRMVMPRDVRMILWVDWFVLKSTRSV